MWEGEEQILLSNQIKYKSGSDRFESTAQNQMVLNILTFSKPLLRMRWEGGHYWHFGETGGHSVLLQNEEGEEGKGGQNNVQPLICSEN